MHCTGLGSWCAQRRGGSGLIGTTSISELQAAAPCCRPLLSGKDGEGEQKCCFSAQKVLKGTVQSLLQWAVCCGGFLRLKESQCNNKKMQKNPKPNQNPLF